jgi:hypothetical protein
VSPFGNSLALKCRLGLLPRRATAPVCALSSAAGRTLGRSGSISRPRGGSSSSVGCRIVTASTTGARAMIYSGVWRLRPISRPPSLRSYLTHSPNLDPSVVLVFS